MATAILVNQLLPRLRQHRVVVTAVVNCTVAAACFPLAWLLQGGSPLAARPVADWIGLLVALLIVKATCFALADLNDGWWRFVGIREVPRFVWGNVMATAVFTALLWSGGRSAFAPPRVLLLDCWLCTTGLLATRVLRRYASELPSAGRTSDAGGERLLVVGAGRMGARLVEQLQQEARPEVSGFLDDDPQKWGVRIRGVEVLGGTSELEPLISQRQVSQVAVAVASPDATWLRRIMGVCERHGVRCRLLPSLSEVLNGRAVPGQVRDIQLEELLGRAPVKLLDERTIAGVLNGKAILVTGGSGSIGSELCRQIARFGPSRLVVLDKDESGIFFMQHELQRRFPGLELHVVIADIRNAQRLGAIFRQHRISMVFHAAAYKHVPLMEDNVYEAVSTNVGGTANLVRLAQQHGCEKFVLISTDKAVRPCSVMGATKRAAELVLDCMPRSETVFSAVRFGNVLGSAGSVVPLFQKQILAGGPVTVTHPEVTRYFMTVQEAVQLVLHSSALAHSRELFMLDMGEPVSILEVAENLIRLFGLQPYAEVPIEFSGLRPGEKLHEELLLQSERNAATSHPKVFRVQKAEAGAACSVATLDRLSSLLGTGEDAPLLDWLRDVVQEYRPSLRLAGQAPPARPITVLKPRLVGARGHRRDSSGVSIVAASQEVVRRAARSA